MACLAAPQCLCGLLWGELACSRALDFSPGLGVQAPSLGCPGTTRSQGRKSRTEPLTRSHSLPLDLLLHQGGTSGREGGGEGSTCRPVLGGPAKALVPLELFLSLQTDFISSQYIVEMSGRVSHGGSCCFLCLWNWAGGGDPWWGQMGQSGPGPLGPPGRAAGLARCSLRPPHPRGILSLGVWVGEDSPSGSQRLPCFTKPPLQSPSLCDSACCPRRA